MPIGTVLPHCVTSTVVLDRLSPEVIDNEDIQRERPTQQSRPIQSRRALPRRLHRRSLGRALLLQPRLRPRLRERHSSQLSRTVVRLALTARGTFVRYALSPREEPLHGRQRPNIRSYPQGYTVESLGTFPKTCPVKHATGTAPPAAKHGP